MVSEMNEYNREKKKNELLKKIINRKNKSLSEKIETFKLSREIDKEKFENAIKTMLKK